MTPYYWTVCKNNTRKKTDEELAREEEIETAMYEFQSKFEQWETSYVANNLWQEYVQNAERLGASVDEMCKLQDDYMKKCDVEKLKFARKIIKESLYYIELEMYDSSELEPLLKLNESELRHLVS